MIAIAIREVEVIQSVRISSMSVCQRRGEDLQDLAEGLFEPDDLER